MKRKLNLKLSGDAVYYTNSATLRVKNMLCSKHLCQKGFNSIFFSHKDHNPCRCVACGGARAVQFSGPTLPTADLPRSLHTWMILVIVENFWYELVETMGLRSISQNTRRVLIQFSPPRCFSRRDREGVFLCVCVCVCLRESVCVWEKERQRECV